MGGKKQPAKPLEEGLVVVDDSINDSLKSGIRGGLLTTVSLLFYYSRYL